MRATAATASERPAIHAMIVRDEMPCWTAAAEPPATAVVAAAARTAASLADGFAPATA